VSDVIGVECSLRANRKICCSVIVYVDVVNNFVVYVVVNLASDATIGFRWYA